MAIMKDGRLLVCDTVEAIKSAAGAQTLEQAFIHFAKGVKK